MRRFCVCSLIAVAVATLACGKSEEQKNAEKAAEDMRQAAEAVTKAAEQGGAAAAAQGLEGFAKAMEGVAGAMAGTGPDGKPVTPVSFRDLQALLPEVSGWQRDEPRGERMTSPVPFSQTEATYTMGDSTVQLKIVDSGFSQFLIAPWSMFLAAGYEKESSSGYEKSVNLGGNPGFERWDSADKSGELNLVVGKRFLVTIDGSGITDTKILQEFASKIDTTRLAALK
ncbi:MAG: hypothetical protein ACT4QD_20390 [Acidobacteriota bacterium]